MFDDFSGQWWEFWIDHWNRPSLKMQIPHQKGCYAYASCKFVVEQTAIVRSYDLFGLFPRGNPVVHLVEPRQLARAGLERIEVVSVVADIDYAVGHGWRSDNWTSRLVAPQQMPTTSVQRRSLV